MTNFRKSGSGTSFLATPTPYYVKDDGSGNLGVYNGATEIAYFDANGNLIFLGSTAAATALTAIGPATGGGSMDFSVPSAKQFNFRINAAVQFAINSSGVPSTSHGVSLTGEGFPAILARAIPASQTTTQTNLINYTPGATAQTLLITVWQSVTATTGTTIATLGYTDASGTARSRTILFTKTDGTTSAAPGGTGDWASTLVISIDNSNTAVTLTFTVSATATYWPGAILARLT